jgi:LEA14-like dessication related protein
VGTSSGELAGQGRLDIQSRLAFPWPADHAGIMELLGKKQVHYTFNQSCNLEGPEGGLTVSGSDSGMVPLPRLPQMTVAGANAQRFGKDEAKLIFEISILNENAFPVKVDKIIFKITLEGKPLAEGELPVAEIIPANNETTFDIPAEIRTGDASKEIIALLNRPQLSYVLEGQVFMGSFEIPVKGDGTLTFAH